MSFIPVTPYFFNKLSIYQELQEIEQAFSDKELWEMEKELLRWTAKGHKHLRSPIGGDIKLLKGVPLAFWM